MRRHLIKEQLREQMVEMRRDGTTLEQIAQATGKNMSTVKRHLDKGPTFANAKVGVGKDGKTRPTHYKPRQPKTVIATTKMQEEKAMESIARAGGALPNKIVTATRAARIAREFQASNPQTGDNSNLHPNCDLRLGDFRDVLKGIPANSIDLIFTDPPYNSDYLNLWGKLGQLASEVLKPGALLVSYSGQAYLPSVMAALGRYLDYIWLGALIMP